jgi:aminoglycoside phosphotransferase (APT) family kinase protein
VAYRRGDGRAPSRIARSWLSDAIVNGLGGDHAASLSAALSAGARVDLLETSIVHGDFHFRNCLVDDRGVVTGVFDWESRDQGTGGSIS